NFFLGDDPGRWRRSAPTFGAVRYAGLYPGIDLVFRGAGGQLKSEWILHPGSDPAQIRVAYGGDSTWLWLDDDEALPVAAGTGELVEAAPSVYQEVNGRRVAVAGRYVLDVGARGQGPGAREDEANDATAPVPAIPQPPAPGPWP